AARCMVEDMSVEAGRRAALLTPRERQVMQFVVAGKTNKETASVLRLAEKTVEAHRMTIMRKMGVDSIADLVRLDIAPDDRGPSGRSGRPGASAATCAGVGSGVGRPAARGRANDAGARRADDQRAGVEGPCPARNASRTLISSSLRRRLGIRTSR